MRFTVRLSIALLMALVLNAAAARGGSPAGPDQPSGRTVPADSGRVPVRGLSNAYELPRAMTPENFLDEMENSAVGPGRLADHSNLLLMPGEYSLAPEIYLDPSCGNCEEPDTPVRATVGLKISGKGIVIEGSPGDPGSVVLSTGAGYGILFEDCVDCVLRGVTVTGGVRDPDKRATDAGIVVRRSTVKIENCVIRDNIGDSTIVGQTVVGIIGIAGREGANVKIVNNQIIRNSWDGIALYRGARAEIEGNVIDGIDKARGEAIGGGRGVGIGVTWDAKARIEHNLVRRYWKGIGVFVDANCDVVGNVIEEVLAWGIAYWDGGVGRPVARIEKNLVYDSGACGITISRHTGGAPAPGSCVGNMVVRSGLNPKYDDPMKYRGQCPIYVEAVPEGFVIENNIFFYNRRIQCGSSLDDLTRQEFDRQAPPLLEELSAHPALGAARAFGELQGSEEN